MTLGSIHLALTTKERGGWCDGGGTTVGVRDLVGGKEERDHDGEREERELGFEGGGRVHV